MKNKGIGEFHTMRQMDGDYEIRYIAAEDFVECGSIAGEQYFSAVMFGKLYSKHHTPPLFEDDLKFLEECLSDFLQKHKFDIKAKYPHFYGIEPGIEFYQKFNNDGKYSSLLVTIFNDYSKVVVKIVAVEHQTFYFDFYDGDFVMSALLLLKAIKKAKKLREQYPNPRETEK